MRGFVCMRSADHRARNDTHQSKPTRTTMNRGEDRRWKPSFTRTLSSLERSCTLMCASANALPSSPPYRSELVSLYPWCDFSWPKQSVESHQLPDYNSCCSRTRNTPYTPYASCFLCTICWCSVKVQLPLSLTVSMSLKTAVRWHVEVTSETQWQCGIKLLVWHTHI